GPRGGVAAPADLAGRLAVFSHPAAAPARHLLGPGAVRPDLRLTAGPVGAHQFLPRGARRPLARRAGGRLYRAPGPDPGVAAGRRARAGDSGAVDLRLYLERIP